MNDFAWLCLIPISAIVGYYVSEIFRYIYGRDKKNDPNNSN